jgi:N-acetylglucosaminyldiphosphoundecaprenol N-acetyl-beta-D-mannosaminyltransferase
VTAIACLAARRASVHRVRIGLRRCIEQIAGPLLAWMIVAALSPLIAMAFLAGARIERGTALGRNGTRCTRRSVVTRTGARPSWAQVIARLGDIAAGDIAWVGPEPRVPGNLDLRRESARRVLSVRPGLVSLWGLRQRTNIAFGSQLDADCEYVQSRSATSDIALFLRSAAALMYGGAALEYSPSVDILGIPVDNVTMDQALDTIVGPTSATRQVSFVNVDCINRSVTDFDYREILVSSDLRLGDGIGLRIAGRLLRNEIRQNVNGTDLFPRLCDRMEEEHLSVYLLGGRPGVADGVAAWIASRYPDVRVAGAEHGYFTETETPAVINRINRSGAAILLVAFGAPRQEKWIRRHASNLRVRSALGVGGLFDFYSGRIPRAPQWLRELGLEWTYRLYQEPRRMWRRYLVGNVVFLWRVITAKANKVKQK